MSSIIVTSSQFILWVQYYFDFRLSRSEMFFWSCWEWQTQYINDNIVIILTVIGWALSFFVFQTVYHGPEKLCYLLHDPFRHLETISLLAVLYSLHCKPLFWLLLQRMWGKGNEHKKVIWVQDVFVYMKGTRVSASKLFRQTTLVAYCNVFQENNMWKDVIFSV